MIGSITKPYTDCYFTKTYESLVKANRNPLAVWQVFQKKDSVFCGFRDILKHIGSYALEIWSLNDGEKQSPGETSMLLVGYAQDMVQLETIYLGILARETMVATNVNSAVQAANGKPVLFFPGRFDVPDVQGYDGYAALIGGAAGCATMEQASAFGADKPVGTMPHALIALFGGDTAAAALAFADAHPHEDVWVLVDFNNFCADDTIKVIKAFREKGILHRLAGVRLDTSEKLVDKGIQMIAEHYTKAGIEDQVFRGVNPFLVNHVRAQIDTCGIDAKHIKIAVSGGFNPDKIRKFEELRLPVDVYAIGESFIRGSNAYTSDVVGTFDEKGDFHTISKAGRGFKFNSRLTLHRNKQTPLLTWKVCAQGGANSLIP